MKPCSGKFNTCSIGSSLGPVRARESWMLRQKEEEEESTDCTEHGDGGCEDGGW